MLIYNIIRCVIARPLAVQSHAHCVQLEVTAFLDSVLRVLVAHTNHFQGLVLAFHVPLAASVLLDL